MIQQRKERVPNKQERKIDTPTKKKPVSKASQANGKAPQTNGKASQTKSGNSKTQQGKVAKQTESKKEGYHIKSKLLSFSNELNSLYTGSDIDPSCKKAIDQKLLEYEDNNDDLRNILKLLDGALSRAKKSVWGTNRWCLMTMGEDIHNFLSSTDLGNAYTKHQEGSKITYEEDGLLADKLKSLESGVCNKIL